MAVSGDRPQGGCLGAARRVQIDAVEIVARLLRRDRELRFFDQPFEIGGGEFKAMRHLARGEIGKVALRQCLQREPGTAGADRQHRPIAGGLEHDLRPLRELANDLVKHVCRHRGRAARGDLGGNRLGYFQIEIGRFEGELGAFGLDQHVCQDRNCIAALDHAVDVAERLQQRCAFDGDLHVDPARGQLRVDSRVIKVARAGTFRKGARARKGPYPT